LNKTFLLIFRIFIVCGVLYFLFKHANPGNLVHYIDKRMVMAFLAMQPVLMLCLFQFAIRLSIIARSPRLPFISCMKAVWLSWGFNTLIPGRLAEFFKPAYLYDHTGLPMSQGISTIFFERILDIFLLVTTAGILFGHVILESTLMLILTASLMLGLIGILILGPLAQKCLNLIPWQSLKGFLEKLLLHLKTNLKSKKIFVIIFFTLTAWSLSFMSILAFLWVLSNGSIQVIDVLKIFIVGFIGLAIPIFPGGIGTYEAGVSFVLKGLGYDFEEALVISVILHIGQSALGVIGAFIIMFTDRIGIVNLLRRLKDLKTEKR